jgi:hypothetical protein
MNGAATAIAERETGFPDAGRRQTPSIKSPPPGAAEVICEDGLCLRPASQSLRRLMSATDDRAAEGIRHLETTVLDLFPGGVGMLDLVAIHFDPVLWPVITSASSPSSSWLSQGQEFVGSATIIAGRS